MKKRIFSILLCLCMVLMLCPVTALADVPPDTIVGDLDFDGNVTTIDAVRLQKYLEGLESFTKEQLVVADFNGDGVVNYSDLTELQSHLKLPVSDITVENGKATACGIEISEAAFGTMVTLTADTPVEDQVFDKWVVNLGGVTLADASSATTTFTMSMCEDPVSVTATYKPLSASEPGSLAITVNGFQVGNTPKDITFSFASTIPGVTFSKDDIKYVGWEKFVFDEYDYPPITVNNTEVFEAGVRYRCVIQMDNKGLDKVPAVTMNGKTPDCGIVTNDRVPVALQMDCELGTPALPPITLTVPFTTTVKLGGSEAPGKTTFELAVVDNEGVAIGADDVTVSGSVTTNGAGDYEGELTFTGSFEQLYRMLGDGVFVQQVNAGAPNWTYDDTVWSLKLQPIELATDYDDTAPEYILLICPATLMTSGNGSYYVIDDENPVDQMTFTNTYTYSYSAPVRDTATIIIGGEKEESKPVEENPNTGAPVAANMSTISVLVLAAAVAVLKTRKR